jgi:hypothetical protein
MEHFEVAESTILGQSEHNHARNQRSRAAIESIGGKAAVKHRLCRRLRNGNSYGSIE